MAKTLIIGAGFSGQYAALILKNALRHIEGDHEVIVVNPYPRFTYVPSLIWVGIGQIDVDKTQFDLQPVYNRQGITFILGKVRQVHPDENYVLADTHEGSTRIDYNYLIIASGPYLKYEATPGLGPEHGYTHSICTPPHAIETARSYCALVERLRKGDTARIVIGTGHGCCTCQGAGYEFISLVHNDLKDRGLRDRVDLTWVSNEPRPGDMGIDGFEVEKGPFSITSEDMVRALFQDYGINIEVNSHVQKIDQNTIYTEKADGSFREIPYDFAMLIPPFEGQPIDYVDKAGNNIKDQICNPAGFVKVDACYGKPYDEVCCTDWPKRYQNPVYSNIYSCGIAFAPPSCTSRPCVTPNGTQLMPGVPRTGYTSELTGKAVALNVAEMIKGREPCHTASLAETPGLCIASLKNSWLHGSAATIGIQPIVRNRIANPGSGRNTRICSMEIGLAGAWLKKGLHHAFMYKLSAKPLWQYIP